MKPSLLLAIASWTSLFVLTWMQILRWVPLDGTSGGAWGFFFIIAVIASIIFAEPRPKEQKKND